MTNDMGYPFIHPSFLAYMLSLICFFPNRLLLLFVFRTLFCFFHRSGVAQDMAAVLDHKTVDLQHICRLACLVCANFQESDAWTPFCRTISSRPAPGVRERERQLACQPSSLGKNQPIHTGPSLAPRRTTTTTESYDLID